MLEKGDYLWIFFDEYYCIMELDQIIPLCYPPISNGFQLLGFPIIGNISSLFVPNLDLRLEVHHTLICDITASEELALKYIEEYY